METPKKKLRLRKEIRKALEVIEGLIISGIFLALAGYMFLKFFSFI